jgi:hypothetical protein
VTLAQQFDGCHDSFKERVNRIAKVAKLTPLEVYALWREYANDCLGWDQSPVLGEFIEWSKAPLGGNMDELRKAIV